MPTFNQVQIALEACMQAEPPIDFSLSADSNQIATVFAGMQYLYEAERPIEKFSAKQRAAFERWCAESKAPPA